MYMPELNVSFYSCLLFFECVSSKATNVRLDERNWSIAIGVIGGNYGRFRPEGVR